MADKEKELLNLLRQKLEESDDSDRWQSETAIASRIAELRVVHKAFAQIDVTSFSPGEILEWKPGLKNRRRPLYREPAIVIEVLNSPVFDEESRGAGSPYFREPLDIVLGIIDEDSDFISFYYDSRRFRRIPKTP